MTNNEKGNRNSKSKADKVMNSFCDLSLCYVTSESRLKSLIVAKIMSMII